MNRKPFSIKRYGHSRDEDYQQLVLGAFYQSVALSYYPKHLLVEEGALQIPTTRGHFALLGSSSAENSPKMLDLEPSINTQKSIGMIEVSAKGTPEYSR